MSIHPPAGLKAVIFDWAGTMIDFGSRAPVIALLRLFEEHGVSITETEAYEDMGRAKRDHIARLIAKPRIAEAWRREKGRNPAEADIDMLFEAIGPMMKLTARERALLIPGAADLAHLLRSAGVRIGSCTGYTREMMEEVLPRAAEQGYSPDCVVCAGETSDGRPSPLMAWKNLVELGTWPADACVKVDDSTVGIAEGRNAGMWTVGVAASGSELGLSLQEFSALTAQERELRVARAAEKLTAAGAHLVVNTVADLMEALKRIPFGTRP